MRRANRNARLLKNARFRYQVSVDGQKPEITENCALSLGSVSDGMHKASVKAI